MYIILCLIILFNTISNYWDWLLWNVYGVIYCVAISDISFAISDNKWLLIIMCLRYK